MARRFTIELIINLAKSIGANPAKLAGTRSNISFLGKGPTKNPLFQNYLAGLENASKENLGDPKKLFAAIDDAVGWAKDGKLNSIQTEILGHNLSGINKIINPPPLPKLPMASVTPIRSGIAGLTDTMPFGRTTPLTAEELAKLRNVKPTRVPENLPPRSEMITELGAQETGLGAYTAMNAKTGMSRAIARQILQQDTRLKLNPEELFMLRTGKGEPLDLMKKYYGESMMNLDAFLDDVIPRPGMNIKDIATRVLSEVELIPAFAHGGLARILEL